MVRPDVVVDAVVVDAVLAAATWLLVAAVSSVARGDLSRVRVVMERHADCVDLRG